MRSGTVERTMGRSHRTRRAKGSPGPAVTSPRAREPHPSPNSRSLAGTRLLITGANTGIGLALAREALALGADTDITCRTTDKLARTLEALRTEFPARTIGGWVVDFARMESVAALADSLREAAVGIDRLLLNAGVHVPFGTRHTVDGFELHRQVNFLGPAYLFRRLAEQKTLRRGAIYVSSDAHHRGHIPAFFPLSFWARYARSKLDATTFFQAARPLFPHLEISVLSPGNVESEVHRYKPSWVRALRRLTSRGRAPVAAAREILDGAFFSPDPEQYRNRGRPEATAPRCADPERIEFRWNEVDALVERFGTTDGESDLRRIYQVHRNHAETVVRLGPRTREPKSVLELAALVRAARDEGRTVRVVGSKHSYNDCFYSHEELISLVHFDHIGEIDEVRNTVTVGAGVSVQALCDHLDARGYTLRWAGNSGVQTFVGAALTGTHGYAREGGLLAELIVGVRAVTGMGEIVELASEADLQAVRVSLGTLCIVVRATIEIQRKTGFVDYRVRTLDEDDLVDALPRLGRAHEYFRFFPNRLRPGRFSILTIDRTDAMPDPDALERIGYIDQAAPPAPLVAILRRLLRSGSLRAALGRLPSPPLGLAVVAEFSSLMFVNAGITNRAHRLVGLVYQAWNNDRTRNLELALRPADFRAFLNAYRESLNAFPAARDAYFTGRWVGASCRTLLGANHGRDVIFLDVHVTDSASASDFLRDLEHRVSSRMPTRPHWGKEFASGRAQLRDAFPPRVWAEFSTAKARLDPDNVFSNGYTRRVFGW